MTSRPLTRTTVAIDIDAPARLVFDLARDVERWPALLPHYLHVRVVERHADGVVTAEMVAVRSLIPVLGYGLPVAWRARTWARPDDLELRFVHLGGATAGMDVTWRIDPTRTGCSVRIEHDFGPRLGPWATVVDRLFVHPIATRTLATFKAIAEAVVASRAEVERSEPAPPSNTST
jgi:ribosome-associated toxin RatA of RatAB toxin-antitoxin module